MGEIWKSGWVVDDKCIASVQCFRPVAVVFSCLRRLLACRTRGVGSYYHQGQLVEHTQGS